SAAGRADLRYGPCYARATSRACHPDFVARAGRAERIPAKERSTMRTHITILTACALALSAGGAWAMGNDPAPSSASTKPAAPTDYSRAKAMIEARNYNGAIPLLQQAVAKDPRNADAYNLLGYATRKSGNPQGSLQYYNTALQIDPKHLGANEYIGE